MNFDWKKVTFKTVLVMIAAGGVKILVDPIFLALIADPWKTLIPKFVTTAMIAGGLYLAPSPFHSNDLPDPAPPAPSPPSTVITADAEKK
jgi:hypothetical protein